MTKDIESSLVTKYRKELGDSVFDFCSNCAIGENTLLKIENGSSITDKSASRIIDYINRSLSLDVPQLKELTRELTRNQKKGDSGMFSVPDGLTYTRTETYNDSSTQNSPSLGISFPEEYFQAGTNLLSYFSTYLRKNYPGESAKVSITQDGLAVSLIIECEDGTTNKIEELLSDYIEGITGERTLTEITTSDMALLDFKQQLTSAKATIENQHMLLSYAREEVVTLKTLFSQALCNPTVLTVSPTNVTNVGVKVEVSDPQLHSDLREMQSYLGNLDDKESKEAAKNIEKAAKAAEEGDESAVKKYLKAAGKYAVETATKVGAPVAQAYIKDWMGLGK